MSTRPSHSLDPLWASTLEKLEVDPLARVVRLHAHAQDSGAITKYLLTARGVKDFRYSNHAKTFDWPYVEISSVETQSKGPQEIQVRLELWEDECEIVLIASEVVLQQKGDGS